MSIEKNAGLKASLWTIIGYGSTQGLRFISNLILTRLLSPDIFGLMALVNTFVMGLNLFSDIGIRPSIIQNKRGNDPDFLNTAWTIQVLRGIALSVISLLLAFPLSKIYQPEIFAIMPIVGLTALVNGFNSTALATLNRNLQVGKLTLFETLVQLLSLSVTIIWAYFYPSIWALVAGVLFSANFGMIRSYMLIPGQFNRFHWDPSAVKELMSFGRWIFVSTMMTFLSSQADRLILGKLFSLEMLGIYTIAFTLADMPRVILNSISNKVLFPIISKQTNLPREKLREKIIQKRWPILFGLSIFLSLIVSFGDFLILNLYSSKYADAAWMLPILTIGIWPRILTASASPALLALGKPIFGAFGNFSKFFFVALVLPLGFQYWGLLGAIVVVALNDLPLYMVISYGMQQQKLGTFWQDIKWTIFLLGLISLVLEIRWLTLHSLPWSGLLN